jgi:K+-transporting ATPase ATPase C chain
MKDFIIAIKTTAIVTAILVLIVCGIYPITVWGISQIFFNEKANGSLIAESGTILGSQLISQGFGGSQYFHPRPSAAGSGYDAASSGGSNLGPLSKKLNDTIKQRIEAYRRDNSLAANVLIPADAVTASASGLDPHISIKNAFFQVHRVAKARGLSEEYVRKEIYAHTDGRSLGILGEPGVNVLMLNLKLDKAGKKHAGKQG